MFAPDASSGTWAYAANTSGPYNGHLTVGSPANGNYAEWTTPWLDAGTWTLYLLHRKTTSGGVATVTVDGGSSLGTIDTYNASTLQGQTGSLSLGSLSQGTHTLRLTAGVGTGSGYALNLIRLGLKRTA